VKKYELPSEKPEKEGPDFMTQSLKYMGMGSLVKPGKDAAAAGPAEKEGEASNPPPARPRLASVSTWAGAFRPGGGEASTQKPKKKDDGSDDDDRHIRFTISGVDQRMTKEDFIREVRQYDKRTRSEILEHSNASEAVKRIATKDKPADDSAQSSTRGTKKTEKPAERGASMLKPSAAQRTVSTPALPRGRDDTRRSSPSGSSSATDSSPGASGKGSSEGPAGAVSSRDEPETAVERRRRLAVLQGVDEEDDNEVRETPAERRRREAALGMSSPGAADDDSDDDDTPRVPPAGGRRGIRFADQPSRG
jgi:hypothetical protein